MKKLITVNQSTCKKCLLCTEVCPNKILIKSETGEILIRQERVGTCFKCGQCMAICETQSILIDGLSYEEDFFELPQYDQSNIEKAFSDLVLTRRAIRNFKNKPVPKELLEKIVKAISFAPPGFPPLKTKILVVQDASKIEAALPYMISLYERLLQMMKNPLIRFFIRKEVGKKKFQTMQDHLVPLLESRIPALKEGTENTLTRNAPSMILFLTDKNGEDINQDISIAATYGMLAAHSLGLGGSIMDIIPPPINKDKDLRSFFGIKEEEEVITSLIIGYPKYKYQRGIQRYLKEVRWM